MLAEKDLTLMVGSGSSQLPPGHGYDIIMTRTSDRGVNEPPRDLTGDDKVTLADELQARIDLANSRRRPVAVLHFNGIANPGIRGTQTFYSEGRP